MILEIHLGELDMDGIAVLAGLPALSRLVLKVNHVPAGGIVFSKGAVRSGLLLTSRHRKPASLSTFRLEQCPWSRPFASDCMCMSSTMSLDFMAGIEQKPLN